MRIVFFTLPSKNNTAIILIPKVDRRYALVAGKCVEVCQFHALARIGTRVIVSSQLCHGCGSCTINCPVNAITEEADPIGLLEAGHTIPVLTLPGNPDHKRTDWQPR